MTSPEAGSAGRSTRMRTKARTRLILAMPRSRGKVTKVLHQGGRSRILAGLRIRSGVTGVLARLTARPMPRRKPSSPSLALGLVVWLLLPSTHAVASPDPQCPQTTSALYSRIRSVGLDHQRVYRIREASIDRPNLHLDFEDGTLAFTEDICGRTAP